METFKLVLEVCQAVGAFATAISLIVLLSKYRSKLKVDGEMPIKNVDQYLIRVYNNTAYDNEITSISFWKGNPVSFFSSASLFFLVSFSSVGQPINENTRNISLPKESNIEIPIPCHSITLNYDNIREAIGKPYDTIYVLIRDRRGHKYCINTHSNIDMFRIVSKSR